MGSFYHGDEVPVRERRLNSILSYQGTASELYKQSEEKKLTCKGRYYGQCSDCAEGCAETIMDHVVGAAVINHAPVGCAVLASMHNITSRAVSEARGLPQHKVKIINTNIEEKDTVFGAAAKLKGAILEADRRFQPKAIFISASCASGIIGEDIESVADEAEAELGYPVIPIYCEGFKSKIWSSGFDAAFHGVLRKLIKPPRKRQNDLVNIFNFEGSDTFSGLLKKLNLRANYVVPLVELDELAYLSEAACTATICETLSTYVAASLEELYGVPEVKVPAPYGVAWTDDWIRAIASYTGREELAEKVIAEEHARIESELRRLREKLKGKKIYVISGDSFAHNIASIAVDLGMEVIGANTLHHDQKTDAPNQPNTLKSLVEKKGEIPHFTVCNKQPFQLVKIVKALQPDIITVRHGVLTTLGTKLGIPAIFEGDANYSMGYDGVIKMGYRIERALKTKKLEETIAKHSKLPYTDWWLQQENTFYFEQKQ